jgi:hypothetical protein
VKKKKKITFVPRTKETKKGPHDVVMLDKKDKSKKWYRFF